MSQNANMSETRDVYRRAFENFLETPTGSTPITNDVTERSIIWLKRQYIHLMNREAQLFSSNFNSNNGVVEHNAVHSDGRLA